jgi:enamine deaminase RidA (YjgF/YER057c/UK114 family)
MPAETLTRSRIPAGSVWGETFGYSRAVRVGSLIVVSGTAATSPDGRVLHPGEPGPQTQVIFLKIEEALKNLGSSLSDIVETRVFITNVNQWEEVGRIHGATFRATKPATTMVEVSRLIHPEMAVEISALAIVG